LQSFPLIIKSKYTIPDTLLYQYATFRSLTEMLHCLCKSHLYYKGILKIVFKITTVKKLWINILPYQKNFLCEKIHKVFILFFTRKNLFTDAGKIVCAIKPESLFSLLNMKWSILENC